MEINVLQSNLKFSCSPSLLMLCHLLLLLHVLIIPLGLPLLFPLSLSQLLLRQLIYFHEIQVNRYMCIVFLMPATYSSNYNIHNKTHPCLPNIGLPRLGYPLMVSTWLWSAVTITSVSSSLVISIALATASSKAMVSVKAMLATPLWCPWSIRPPDRKQHRQKYRLTSFDEFGPTLVLRGDVLVNNYSN